MRKKLFLLALAMVGFLSASNVMAVIYPPCSDICTGPSSTSCSCPGTTVNTVCSNYWFGFCPAVPSCRDICTGPSSTTCTCPGTTVNTVCSNYWFGFCPYY